MLLPNLKELGLDVNQYDRDLLRLRALDIASPERAAQSSALLAELLGIEQEPLKETLMNLNPEEYLFTFDQVLQDQQRYANSYRTLGDIYSQPFYEGNAVSEPGTLALVALAALITLISRRRFHSVAGASGQILFSRPCEIHSS